jgi:hypothetical protein
MTGYVYILSNRSMPGLVKIGKTTTSPSQRMAELHSTGVPTPFELEFAAEVADCHSCERDAHSALTEHRVSSKREFFRVSVPEAIKKILPMLGDYTLVNVKESHGIEEIEADLQRQFRTREAVLQKQIKVQEAADRARQAERSRVDRELASEKARRVARLQGQLTDARRRLNALGRRPERNVDILETFLMCCWLPVPLGWIVWVGALQVFSAKHEGIGIVCILLLIAGFFINKQDNESVTRHSNAVKPFSAIETEITNLEKAIRDEGATPAPKATSQIAAKDGGFTEKVVVPCPECHRKMRLPAKKKLDATCPYCRKIYRINT